MQIAISTGSLAATTPAALERAAALGFDQVEINLQSVEFDYSYRRKPNARFYRELRQQLDGLGLSVWSVTTPPLTQAQMFSARARREVLLGAAGAAGILGARVTVAQPADLFLSEEALQGYWQNRKAPPVIDGYDEAWAQVVNRRMTLALANLDYWIGTPVTNQAELLARAIDDLAIGAALDVPRAVQRNTLPAWLEKVGQRLAVAYLYDWDEAGRPLAPVSEQALAFLQALETTRLKCVVIQAGAGQDDSAVLASREQLARALN